jgi:predicted DNA-binding protein with PD1-like motif
MEVVSLTGNLALEETGKLVYHLHGVFANDEYHTVACHVQDLVAGFGCRCDPSTVCPPLV